MLEKFLENSKIIYCDSHYHLADIDLKNCFASSSDGQIFKSYGIHPETPDSSFLQILQDLLEQKKLQAVGECGFDFYNHAPKSISEFDSKSVEEIQTEIFISQIKLAKKYNLPVIIHCRKANEKLFEFSSELKKLPSVLFHSFMGSVVEAQSLLNRGINGYFSFGKQILTGNKKAIQCVKELPIERLLLETDSQYKDSEDGKRVHLSEIAKIYKGAFNLRFGSDDLSEFQNFSDQLKSNFRECFGNPL